MLMGHPTTFGIDAVAWRRIELAAIKAVMGIDLSLGFVPINVSAQDKYFDIEFKIPIEQKENAYAETGHFVVAPDGIILNTNANSPNKQRLYMPFTQVINSTVTVFQSPVELFGKLELEGKKAKFLRSLKKWIRIFLISPLLL